VRGIALTAAGRKKREQGADIFFFSAYFEFVSIFIKSFSIDEDIKFVMFLDHIHIPKVDKAFAHPDAYWLLIINSHVELKFCRDDSTLFEQPVSHSVTASEAHM
jgi:hypothetical protein